MYSEIELHKLIRVVRERKGIARTKFAHIVGISPSSMVKYELPESEGGKIPSSTNLAKICELLEIDPRDAFDAINTSIRWKEEKDNPKPRSWPQGSERFFRFAEFFATDTDWMRLQYSVQSIEDLHSHLAEIGAEMHWLNSKMKHMNMVLEGKDPSEEAQKKHEEFRARMEKNKAEYLSGGNENGPDQNDPSRSEKSKTNSKAVSAASTKLTKGKSDDVD